MCQPQSCTQTVFLSGMGSVQYVPALVMYPDCVPVWHGQCSVCASPSQCMCWNRRQCPFLRQNMVLAVSRCRSRQWSASLRLSGTGWVMVFASVKEMGYRGRCYIELLASFAKESNHRMNPATDYAGQGPLKTCFSSSSVLDGMYTL